MGYLLDTNVLSEPQRRKPSPAVLGWLSSLPAGELWTSSLVIGELRRGVELLRRRDADHAEQLDAWLGDLVAHYAERILPVSTGTAELWGHLNVPNPVPVIDGYLAATASYHGLTLATRNVKDIERTGVRWINPFDWTPPRPLP